VEKPKPRFLIMKILSKTSKLAFSLFFGLVLASITTNATEPTDQIYTYVFTANLNQPLNLNGSTLTIENEGGGNFSVLGFDFIDTGEAGSPFTSSYDNFSIADILSANASGWSGTFDAINLDGTDGYSGLNGRATTDSLSVEPAETTRANGVWTLRGVPDNGQTFSLLLGVCVVLGGIAASRRQTAGQRI
jgi:hypothetical protein